MHTHRINKRTKYARDLFGILIHLGAIRGSMCDEMNLKLRVFREIKVFELELLFLMEL